MMRIYFPPDSFSTLVARRKFESNLEFLLYPKLKFKMTRLNLWPFVVNLFVLLMQHELDAVRQEQNNEEKRFVI